MADERQIRTGRKPRVVIENPRSDSAANELEGLVAAGFDVEVCAGPDSDRDGCPLLSEGRCELLESADVVLYDLDLADPTHHEVLERMRARYPQLPVVVEVPAGTARHEHAVLEGVHVVVPYDAEHLRDAVVRATAG